jgi:hypothetical protein
VCRCVYYGTTQNLANYRQMMAERKLATEQESEAIMEQATMPGQHSR